MSSDLTPEQQKVLRVLDFTPAAPRCDAKDHAGRVACAERASWSIRCRRCSWAFLLCGAHKRELVERSLDQRSACPECRVWRFRLDDVVDIVPLGALS